MRYTGAIVDKHGNYKYSLDTLTATEVEDILNDNPSYEVKYWEDEL